MEARESLRGAGPSKMLVAVIAIGTTLALGVVGGLVVKNISGATTTNPNHIVQAQTGRAQVYPKHAGVQMIDETSVAPLAGARSANGRGAREDSLPVQTSAPTLAGARSANGRGDNAGDAPVQTAGARSASGHGAQP